MADALNQAKATVNVIEARYTRGGDLTNYEGNDTWAVIDAEGHLVAGAPELAPFVPDPLRPAEPGTPPLAQTTVHLGPVDGSALPRSRRLAGHDFTLFIASFQSPGPLDGVAAPAGHLTLHLLVTPWEAEQAVADIDSALYGGIPAAVLLVALIVWATTSRALRPVEGIQQRLRAITARDLSLRVPVPPRRDEIARLAATTNDTLDRLEQAVEQQRRFTADASHELRTPLAALRADLEVALHYPDHTDWPSVIRDTLDDAERLQQLTEDLLLLADLDNHTSLPAHRVDLGHLARNAAAQARRHAPAAVRVDCRAADDIAVHGDARQLERLLRNLLDNAVRHARSTVTLTVTSHGTTVVLEVRDDGTGVPPEQQERIFERFARLDASRTRDAGGTGLGLAIAREIAHRHGGTLRLDGTASTGACFIAEVPLELPR
ncbi:sensor histidine kinase [Kitasatospora sp. NPDC008050]|uniref:sensor histidine kinase n=1 Tax=Kitasatospora sp. NPDC008050 TaxID=3364021 RepID=UPI0036EBCF98